jgi:hypothetical protein
LLGLLRCYCRQPQSVYESLMFQSQDAIGAFSEAREGSKGIRTTERESLNRCEPAEKALYWGLGSW